MMAKKRSQNKTDVPCTIYQRNKRYWWKVQLPGEEKQKARPLKPVGLKFATTDQAVALEIAHNQWQEAIYKSPKNKVSKITNTASLASAYLVYVDGYYIDEGGKPTNESTAIRYSLKPLT